MNKHEAKNIQNNLELLDKRVPKDESMWEYYKYSPEYYLRYDDQNCYKIILKQKSKFYSKTEYVRMYAKTWKKNDSESIDKLFDKEFDEINEAIDWLRNEYSELFDIGSK